MSLRQYWFDRTCVEEMRGTELHAMREVVRAASRSCYFPEAAHPRKQHVRGIMRICDVSRIREQRHMNARFLEVNVRFSASIAVDEGRK